jgi:glutamate--cysteine ligase
MSKVREILKEALISKHTLVTEWFDRQRARSPFHFYSSVDLRDSGEKIAPVDCNLFPAGFNNICADDLAEIPRIFSEQWLHSLRFSPERIVVIPERHTENLFYLENLRILVGLLRLTGADVRIGWYDLEKEDREFTLNTASGEVIEARPIRIRDGILSVGEFIPDLVVLNNDFSSGYPKPLDEVRQPIAPSHKLGWHSRKKSSHFKHYNALAEDFARTLEIDPWLITIDTREIADVDFNESVGLDRVVDSVGAMLEQMRSEYQKRGIQRQPTVFLKNNSGTYGMGILAVHSVEELKAMNRRTKNKMSVGKNRLQISSVIAQEGIPTTARLDQHPAEPVIYLSGCELIGGFLRSNTEKGDEDNLNSAGMVLQKLCVSDLARILSEDPNGAEDRHLELVYGTIARLSALAAGRESIDFST